MSYQVTINLSADTPEAARKLFDMCIAHTELSSTPYDDAPGSNGSGKLIMLKEHPGGAAQVYKWEPRNQDG